jgi:hypothetical protein
MMPFAIIMLLVLFIFYFSFRLFLVYIEQTRPPTTARAVINPVFNKIKSPVISDAVSSGQYTYTLDTLEGTPVTATEAAQVFFLPQSPQRFGFLQKIYLMAKAAGFDTELTKHNLKDNDATFNDGLRTMTIDKTSFNFTFDYTLTKEDPILVNPTIPSEQEIKSRAIEFLRSVDRYPEELAKGNTHIVYFSFNAETNQLSIVETPAEANMAEVDFYRPDIGPFQIVTPKYYNSPDYVLMAFGTNDFKVVRAQVKLYEKSTEQIGQYPIKSGDTAWEELKTGKGYVVSAPVGQTDIIIKKMIMGYYDPDVYQEYLQPVYVFLGDNNFVAYVPAVTDAWMTR